MTSDEKNPRLVPVQKSPVNQELPESSAAQVVSGGWVGELKRILFSKKAVVFIALLLIAIGMKVGISFFLRDGAKDIVPAIRVVHPTMRSMDVSLSLPGNVEAIQQASVYAHISGYLRKIYVDEGDHVKKGQLLAEIESPEAIGDYNKNKADLNLKKVTKERYDELLKENVISRQEYDTVTAAYDETRARYEGSAANMDYTHIRAPFDGAIARRYKYPGDLITTTSGGEQSPIFMLVNESHLRVSINVPQIDVSHVQIGDKVDIKVDAYPDRTFPGKVSRLDDLLDSATKTQRVLIDIDNADGKLHAGMFANVVLHFAHNPDAVVVRAETVENEDGKNFVYLDVAGRVQKMPVAVGLKQDDSVEILSGIKLQDLVILKGMTTLKEGERVQLLSEAK